jgi:hypothetical protein
VPSETVCPPPARTYSRPGKELRPSGVVSAMKRGFLLICALLGAGCDHPSAAPAPPASGATITSRTGDEFTLSPSAKAEVAGLEVRFVRVESDDRCLLGDECSGVGAAKLRVEVGSSSHTLGFISRGAPEMPSVEPCLKIGELTLRVTDVVPWPRNGGTVAPGDYRASFRVAPSCEWVPRAP